MEDIDKQLKEDIESFVRKTQVSLIKQMGDEIGYGQLMSLASALWRAKLKETNTPVSDAFIPTIIDFLKGEEKEMAEKEVKHFDSFIKNNTL